MRCAVRCVRLTAFFKHLKITGGGGEALSENIEGQGVTKGAAYAVSSTVGSIVGVSLFMGLFEHSMTSAITVFCFVGFMCLPQLASLLAPLAPLFMQMVKRLWLCAFGLLMLFGVERSYFLSSWTYPHFLSKEIVSQAAEPGSLPYTNLCSGLYIIHKTNGYFARCGEFWFFGNTYYLKNYDQVIAPLFNQRSPAGSATDE
jgi:hypothetical protein